MLIGSRGVTSNMTRRLVIVRGPSCCGKSTLVRGLAKFPRLNAEYLMSDRFTFFFGGSWYADQIPAHLRITDYLQKLGRLAGELLTNHGDRDIIVEECFASPDAVATVVKAAGRSLSDPSVFIITLFATKERCAERCQQGGRRDKRPGDFQEWGPGSEMVRQKWWLGLDTEALAPEKVLQQVQDHLLAMTIG